MTTPPNYRPVKDNRCGSCGASRTKMRCDDNGAYTALRCLAYSYNVEFDFVCDSYTEEFFEVKGKGDENG